MGWHVGVIGMQTPGIIPVAIPSTSASVSGGTGVAAKVTTPSAFTPAANALILVSVTAFIGTFGPPTLTASDTLGGLAWTELTTGWFTDAANDEYKTSVFYAFAPSSPTSGKVTITASAVSRGATSMTITAHQATGVNMTTPIAQSASALIHGTSGNGTTTHTLTATLASTPVGSAFAVLGQQYGVIGGSQPGTDPDFTHLTYFVGTFNTPVELDIDVSYAVSGSRQSVTWSGLVEGGSHVPWWYYGLLIELNN